MKFVIIDPASAKVEKVKAKDLYAAFKFVGLKPGEVDFGTIFLDASGPASASSSTSTACSCQSRWGDTTPSAIISMSAERSCSPSTKPGPCTGPEANPIEPRRPTEGSPLVPDKATTGLRRTAHP